MSLSEAPQIVVRQLEERDLETLWQVYESSFGAAPVERLRKRWRWQFVDNPACRHEASSIWVAELDGRVVAQLGAFPVLMKILDRETIIQFDCDFAVDQEARNNRKPGLSLSWPAQFLREALQRNPSPLKGGTDYTAASVLLYKRFLKTQPLNIVPHCSRPCRAARKLRELSGSGRWPRVPTEGMAGFATRMIATAGLKAVNALTMPSRDRALVITRITEPGEEFDELWRNVGSHYPITTVRNRSFIRWRFFEDPVFENVLFGAYREGGDLAGYIAVRTGRADDGEVRGRLLDLFCDIKSPKLASSLLSAAIEHLEQAGVSTITCRGMHPELRRIIRRSFYRPSREDYEADRPAWFAWKGAAELAEAVYNENNWHFTYADGSGGFNP